MNICNVILAATLGLASAGAVHADELGPRQGRTIDLGSVSGVAYYSVERDGFRVVATLGQGATATPVRFEAVLTPGQNVMLSTPRAAGTPPLAIRISREKDSIVVQNLPGVATN